MAHYCQFIPCGLAANVTSLILAPQTEQTSKSHVDTCILRNYF